MKDKLKDKAKHIVEELKREYPDALCSLESENPVELLIATRLSAQCTDARVNIVTRELFARYKTIEDYAVADIAELEAIVRPCGFYKVKAQNIRDMCRMLLSDFGGEVPDNMDDLLKLPGVGRKTANLILGDVYKRPAIVADTHAIRISNLLGLCNSKDPVKVEMQLKSSVEPSEQSDLCHRFVLHGRAVCVARRPKCGVCVLAPYCDYVNQA
ncbi:MAG: endonuclease III [Clostridia bacterium]|nr:endonuclease III [Clostridia bacterium]